MVIRLLTISQLLDIGVIDVETCEPLPNVLVDIWQANATGFYSGVSAEVVTRVLFVADTVTTTDPPEIVDGQVPEGDPVWLRGAWPTDENGVVQFTSTYRLLCKAAETDSHH